MLLCPLNRVISFSSTLGPRFFVLEFVVTVLRLIN